MENRVTRMRMKEGARRAAVEGGLGGGVRGCRLQKIYQET